MDFALNTLINVCFIGFASLMALDFLSGLRALWVNAAAKTNQKGMYALHTPDQKGMHPLHPLDAKGVKNFTPLAEPVSETETLRPGITTPAPCCHSAIAAPQLLLLAGIGGTDQPDLAGLSSTELRRMCQSAGVKWRCVSGSRHLSKNQMIVALGS